MCEQFEGVIVSGGVCSGLRRVSRREEGSLSVCFSVCRGATDTSVCECVCVCVLSKSKGAHISLGV